MHAYIERIFLNFAMKQYSKVILATSFIIASFPYSNIMFQITITNSNLVCTSSYLPFPLSNVDRFSMHSLN